MPKKATPDQSGMFAEQSSREHGKDINQKQPKKVYARAYKREAIPLIDESYNVFALLATSLPMGDKATKKRAPLRTMHQFPYEGGIIEVYFHTYPAPDKAHLKLIKQICELHGKDIAKHGWSKFENVKP